MKKIILALMLFCLVATINASTIAISTTSETLEWVEACSEIEQCEIEAINNSVGFIESPTIPTELNGDNKLQFIKDTPRLFNGDGISKLWVLIKKDYLVVKRPYQINNNAFLYDGNGNQISSIDGNLDISDFYLKVAKGQVVGHKVIRKFGKNPTVGTTGFDTIWNGGGEYTGFNATSAETVTIVSTDINDTLLGGGLRTLMLFGLDADFLEQTEVIELNGTNPVISQLSYIRCDRAKGLSHGGGTFGTNLGIITIAQSITTANIFAQIPIGYGTTMIAAYTIPAGKIGYIITQSAAIANKQSAAVAIRMKVKQPGSVFTVGGEAALNSQGAGFIERKFTVPGQLPPMTDFFIEAEASSEVAVSAFLDILLVDE